MRLRLAAVLVVLVTHASAQQLLILQDTGRTEGGLPVVVRHPNPGPIEAVLDRGFAARLVRLDFLVQQRLHLEGKGPAPEPMYLVLTHTQGGFPRQGFVLDGRPRPLTRWVDLPQSQRPIGFWGAIDQIFSHELAHVIMARLAQVEPLRVPVQTHAVGVRTTPGMAFQEGFGEHAQIMSMDDPGADPATSALLKTPYWKTRAEGDFAAYGRELRARLLLGAPMRMTFPLWFSGDEQVLRYYAVKANAFARRPPVPGRLLAADPYRAYLLDRVLPGSPQDAPRTAAQMVATEGVVSHLFWRWVTSPEIGGARREPTFYASFGIAPQQVDAVDNAYLKIFAVVEESQAADLPALVRAYEKRFPDESRWLDQLVNGTLLGQTLPTAPNLWLVNPAAPVGTTLFDQWRAIPQPHCFDLNAADAVDLAAIPGMSPSLAQAIQGGAPYRSLADLSGVPGMTAPLLAQIRSLEYVPSRAVDNESSALNSLRTMLLAYLWRMLAVWLCATVLAALAMRALEPWRWFRALRRGALASALGLLAVWLHVTGLPGGIWLAFVLLAIPAFLWRLRSRAAARTPVRPRLAHVNPSLRGLLVWAAALAPAWFLSRPWL
jgi:hypothetical protein